MSSRVVSLTYVGSLGVGALCLAFFPGCFLRSFCTPWPQARDWIGPSGDSVQINQPINQSIVGHLVTKSINRAIKQSPTTLNPSSSAVAQLSRVLENGDRLFNRRAVVLVILQHRRHILGRRYPRIREAREQTASKGAYLPLHPPS